MDRALVTDCRSIAALAAIRSLGRRGIKITAGESFKENYAFYSKYARKQLVYSEPKTSEEDFMADIIGEISNREYSAVIPIRDDAYLAFSKNIDEIKRYSNILIPDYNTQIIGRDKALTVEYAKKFNIPIPRSFVPDSDTTPETIIDYFEFPIILKPRLSSGARGIILVNNSEELEKTFPEIQDRIHEYLIQEFIAHTREHFSASFIYNYQSRLRAAFGYQEQSIYPIKMGSVVSAVSVENEEILHYGKKFLDSLNWVGMANLDYIVDPRDGVAKLMEINPRFFNATVLAYHAGVDFPHLMYRIITEGDCKEVFDYKVGVSFRWLLPMEILWFIKTKKNRKNITKFLTFWKKNQHYAVISFRDLGPVWGFIRQSLHFLKDKKSRSFVLR